MAAEAAELTPVRTPEEIADWLELRDARGRAWIEDRGGWLPPSVRDAWIVAFKAGRAHLFHRAPECDDYRALIDRVYKAAGNPESGILDPPTPDEQRAIVDEGLAALWNEALARAPGAPPKET